MPSRVQARVRLSNARGLHARPCSAIVALALAHRSTLKVRCNGTEVDGRSILSLMTLGAAHGSELEFVAEGDDAAVLLARLRELVESGFDEHD